MGNSHNFKLSFQFSVSVPAHTTGASNQSFKCVFQARFTLTGFGYLSQLTKFNISQFLNCTTRFFAEPGGFSCSLQIGNDRFWYGNQLVACPPIFEFWSSFRDLQVLWNPVISEINFKFGLFFRNR